MAPIRFNPWEGPPMHRSRGCLVLGLSLCLACPVASQPTRRGTDKPQATDRHGDLLPDGAFARLGTQRLRHCGEVLELAFSPDGKTLLSGGGQQDPAVYLWDTATGQRRRRLPVERPVRAVAFSPDGKRIAAYSGLFGADFEKIVRVWDSATGRELHKLELGTTAYSLCFSPDGKTLGISGTEGLLMLWELGKPPRRLEGQKGGGQVFAFSPDGKRFATAANEFPDPSNFRHKVVVLRLWDGATGKVLHELRHHWQDSVNALAFSPDSKWLATGGQEERNSVRVWDVATGKELPALERRRGEAWTLRFSPDGRILHAADGRGRTRAWRLPEGKALSSPAK